MTNPTGISRTFASDKYLKISEQTIAKYIEYFVNAFLIDKAERYDVIGRKYIHTPSKYYFTDAGLRNTRLGFRQMIAFLLRIPDSFQKIVVVRDFINPRKDDKGIQYFGIEDFLLNESFVETW